MAFGSAEDEMPSDSMNRVEDMFGDDDELDRMVAEHTSNAPRTARNLNVFPKKNEAAAEVALNARVESMFDDVDTDEDEMVPMQAPPRSIPRRSTLGYNDMSDIFPND